mmetsp:Transcript_1128/g.2380  ORF Transcript_1128/g.2380 Transcript_1128/m.2380 type:complete len:244 (-) Transcript_1128:1119-1850(-)
MSGRNSSAFYAVRVGRGGFQGVVRSWDECSALVRGVPNAQYKKFPTAAEAAAFIAGGARSEAPNSRQAIASYQHEHADQDGGLQRSAAWVIYTDGACESNGRENAVAGYGVFFGPGDPRNVSEPLPGLVQTNNRAEMTAVICALDVVLMDGNKGPVEIRTDSVYVKNGLEQWLNGWKRNRWKLSNGGDVKNRDLWEQLDSRMQRVRAIRPLGFVWVRGHANEYGNEWADRLAVEGAQKARRPR